MAKALSASYQPISAVAINETLYEAFVRQSEKHGTFAHGYTYSGHPVCAAVALETLKIYEERNIVAHVRKVMGRFQDGLRRFAVHPLVGEVRGVGLMAAVELVRDKNTREPFDPKHAVGAACVKLAQKNGLLMRALGDTLAFSPPLIITEPEIDDFLARLGKTLDATAETTARLDQAA